MSTDESPVNTDESPVNTDESPANTGTTAPDQPDPVRRSAALIASLGATVAALAVVAISLSTALRGDPPAPAAPAPAVSDPVAMTARPLAERPAMLCQDVVSKLPETIAGAARRPVTDGAEQNAAYGDPPTTLACGVAEPEVDQTDKVYGLSGVCWRVDPTGLVWTTVDREIPVEVMVPSVDGAAQRVQAVSPAVATAVPRITDVPPGCR